MVCEVDRRELEKGDGYRRVWQTLEGGIRTYTKVYRGESWTRWVFIPRRVVLARVRAQRASGVSWSDLAYVLRSEWWELLPDGGHGGLFAPAGYGGPGRAYANEPVRMKSNRKWLVFAQGGGLDI